MNYFILIIFTVLMYLILKAILAKSDKNNSNNNIIDVDFEEVE